MQESSAALRLLIDHGMLHVAGQLLHMRGEVDRALATYLSLQNPAPVFTYIHRSVGAFVADMIATQGIVTVGIVAVQHC